MIQLYICIFSFLYYFPLWFTHDIEYSSLCYTIEPIVYPFPGGSDSKESACYVGDLGSIPVQEVPLEKGTATHSSILAWRITCRESLAGYSSWNHKELDTTELLILHIIVHIS